MYIFELLEIGKYRIWGGNSLANEYNKPFDKNTLIGESWSVSDIKDSENIILNGEFKNKTIKEVINSNKKEVLGSLEELPFLIKLIDARDKLSIQVHPDDEYAKKHEASFGKNEMWVVMDCSKNAKLLIGLKEGHTKEELKNRLDSDKNIEDMFNYLSVKKGDIFYIPAGLIHAILGDVIIAEIQQPSDITYRLYDWNRVDNSGQKRELHIKKSLDVIKDIKLKDVIIDKKADCNKNIDDINIVKNKYFDVYEIFIKEGESYKLNTDNKTCEAIVVLEGTGNIEAENTVSLEKSKSVLIPATLGEYTIKAFKNLNILRIKK